MTLVAIVVSGITFGILGVVIGSIVGFIDAEHHYKIRRVLRWHGQRAERHAAFHAINGEPDYQDAQRGNYEHAYRTLSTGECLLCIEELSAKARAAWYRPDGINEALAIMRKIAAAAVQAMENHGVVPR
jgi:hypothetical protein